MASTKNIAQLLGRRGGRARAKRLSLEAKKEIASLGGKARAESLQATQRIQRNFNYLKVVQTLRRRGKQIKINRLKNFKGPLPGIYA